MAATQSAQASQDWQKHWDNWFSGQREFFDRQFKNSAEMQNQWSAFFRQWQESLGGSQPKAGAYQQLFAQAGQQYLDMVRHFHAATGQDKPVADISAEWLRGLQQFFLTMLQSNTQPFNAGDAWKSAQEAMTKGAHGWSQAFQTGGPFAQGWNPQGWNAWQQGAHWGGPGMNAGAWNPQGAFQAFDPFGFYASLPGIGYTREKQDAWNHLYNLWTAFNQETRKYNAVMAQVGLEAIHKFQEYVAHPPEGAAPLTSLKEVYAKWVDVCEEVYAKYALSEEYTKIYGEVVNALMAYKGQANKLMDDMADQFNLPTRKEVDSLHQRLHALRRENLELRRAIDEIRGAKGAPKPAAAQAKKSSSKGTGK